MASYNFDPDINDQLGMFLPIEDVSNIVQDYMNHPSFFVLQCIDVLDTDGVWTQARIENHNSKDYTIGITYLGWKRWYDENLCYNRGEKNQLHRMAPLGTKTTPQNAKPNQTKFEPNKSILCLDTTDRWCSATVRSVLEIQEKNYYAVEYDGWDRIYDELIVGDSYRLVDPFWNLTDLF